MSSGAISNERDIKAEEQRNRILDAATRAISRKGYYGTTMDDIVRESGLSKGALYWYFKSKKEIFLALVDRAIESDRTTFLSALEERKTFVEKLRHLFDTYLRFNEKDLFVFTSEERRLSTEFWQQSVMDVDVRSRFKKSYSYWIEYGKRLVDEAIAAGEIRLVDSAAVAALITAFFDGLWLHFLQDADDVPASRIMNTMFDLLLNGLLPRK